MVWWFPSSASGGIVFDALRKSHDIDGSAVGEQTDYQMKVRVHRITGIDYGEDVYVGAKCRADFGDIRFRQGETKLDHWLEAAHDELLMEITSLDFSASAVDSEGNVWAGGASDSKIYVSSNLGRTWTEKAVIPGTPDFFGGFKLLFVDSNDYIYASLSNPLTDAGLYRSIDGGDSFNIVLTLPASCSIWRMAEDASGNLVAAVYDNSVVTTGHAWIYRSINEGADWTREFDLGAAGQHMHGVWYDPYQDIFYACVEGEPAPGGDTGILKSVDGGDTWTWVKQGGVEWWFTAFYATESYRFWGYDVQDRILRTSDDNTFNEVWNGGGGNHFDVFWMSEINGTIYASFIVAVDTDTPYILKTEDEGDNWEKIKTWSVQVPWKGSRYCSHDGRKSITGRIYLDNTVDDLQKLEQDVAVFWVETPTIPIAGTTIHVYYGKDDETSESSGVATFIFFDDFADLDNWDELPQAGASVEAIDGKLHTHVNAGAGAFAMVRTKSGWAGSISIRTLAYLDNRDDPDSNIFALTTVKEATNNPDGIHSIITVESSFRVYEFDDGVAQGAFSVGVFAPLDDVDYILEAYLWEDEVKAIYNDIEVVNPSADYTGISHKIYIMDTTQADSTIATDVYYYWVLIRKYVDPEPAHDAWGAEEAVVWPF